MVGCVWSFQVYDQGRCDVFWYRVEGFYTKCGFPSGSRLCISQVWKWLLERVPPVPPTLLYRLRLLLRCGLQGGVPKVWVTVPRLLRYHRGGGTHIVPKKHIFISLVNNGFGARLHNTRTLLYTRGRLNMHPKRNIEVLHSVTLFISQGHSN